WDVIPGGESLVSFDGRVRAAIGRIAAAHAGQRVAVFTHGGVIGQALALATGSRPFAFNAADNASVSRVVVTASRWYIRTFGDRPQAREVGDELGVPGLHRAQVPGPGDDLPLRADAAVPGRERHGGAGQAEVVQDAAGLGLAAGIGTDPHAARQGPEAGPGQP